MRFGFVGTGTITSAIVEGLQAAGETGSFLMSPRNAETAARLAARFDNVQVAESNQAVLDGSDLVVLAVRPQVAQEVLDELRFRPDHQVVSVIALLPLSSLRGIVAPSTAVTRVVPLPSVALGKGPSAMFPADPRIKEIFDRLGTAIVLDSEDEFDAFATATATMASYFAFAGTISSWMERTGVAPEKAQLFVAQMIQGLSATMAAAPGRTFAELADEHQTRGGLNELVLRTISADGLLVQLDRALDAVMARKHAATQSYGT